jgi:protocatechuate 3,4-dioxygenase beta subunit
VRPLHRLAALAASTLLLLGAYASAGAQDEEPLVLTPAQVEGPFYPVEIPRDHDADLTVVDGSEEVAAGTPLVLEGVLLRADGSPLEGATIEIWQTDAYGVYLHPTDPGFAARDVAFQGFGEAVTEAEGAWAFRTILPEVYGGRPRHIHARIVVEDETLLTTQVYFSGGDIPAEGALDQTGTELDALLVEPLLQADEDGLQILTAYHQLVVPQT